MNTQGHSGWRLGCRVGLLVVLLLAVGRLLCLQGIVFPVRIASGSMATTLVGPHYLLPCGDCRFEAACDAQQQSQTGFAVCPNCGFARNAFDAGRLRPGQRVLIDRAALWLRAPRRWELVAFESRDEQRRLDVKRVVGLPRERITIRDGDLYRDGRILRKSLDQQRRLAILVYDHHYVSTDPRQPPRWAADESESGWSAGEEGFVYRDREAEAGSLDWLTYRHRSCYAGPAAGRELPVSDNYGYNQGVSRSLHEVRDLMLRCELRELDGSGQVRFAVHDGRQRWQVVWLVGQRRLALQRGERTVATADAPTLQDRPRTVEYSLCDALVIFAVDGIELLAYAYEPRDLPFQPTSRPLGIAARGISARVGELQVWRDIYYLDPALQAAEWTGRLGDDEYLVLGDNVPLSRDSRQWLEPGLSRRSLTGKVLAGW